MLNYILRECACEKDMKGLKVLVTAGPTQEAIDPVRYITNHSSGKMGYAIAKAGYAARSRCHTGKWTYCTCTATICESGSSGNSQRYV